MRFSFVLALFILLQACSKSDSLSCVYVPVKSETNPYPELTQFSDCGSIDNNVVSLNSKHLSNIWFEDGVSEVRINNGVYYVNESSKMIQVHMHDNGADSFKEDLSRAINNHKFGFINKSLKLVIPYKYDFAFPFKDGRSLVCNGCAIKPDDEHKEVVDGEWGYIDKKGNVIIDINLSKEEALQK